MIKAIIFDSGGILTVEKPGAMLSFCAKSLGVNLDSFLRAHKKIFEKFQKGQVTEQEYLRFICRQLDTEIPKEKSLWETAYINSYSKVPKMLLLVKKIKQRGYKTALITDTEVPILNHLKAAFKGLFDIEIYSCLEGSTKSSTKIFKTALKRLRAKPEQTLFIDDKSSNCENAKKLNIKTVLFINRKQLLRDLEKLQIIID